MVINRAVGDALFRGDVSDAETEVNRLITAPLNQQQFDALVSFTYNVGGGALAGSSLRKVINSGRPVYRDLFTRWNKVRNPAGQLVVSNGLTNRRNREYERFVGTETKRA
jgi:lysozyme